jgi:hypothetical protein
VQPPLMGWQVRHEGIDARPPVAEPAQAVEHPISFIRLSFWAEVAPGSV